MNLRNPPSLGRSLAIGCGGFTVVSLAGFSVWALAGRWFYTRVGEVGLYAATALVFVGLAGLLLHPLLGGVHRLARFYALFVPAFLAYAVVWSSAWFALGLGLGEWLGSLAGSLTFALWISWRLGSFAAAGRTGPLLFLTHSAGYFLGGILMAWLTRPEAAEVSPALSKAQIGTWAKMGWGLLYGMGFGTGLGAVFFFAQRKPAPAALPN